MGGAILEKAITLTMSVATIVILAINDVKNGDKINKIWCFLLCVVVVRCCVSAAPPVGNHCGWC